MLKVKLFALILLLSVLVSVTVPIQNVSAQQVTSVTLNPGDQGTTWIWFGDREGNYTQGWVEASGSASSWVTPQYFDFAVGPYQTTNLYYTLTVPWMAKPGVYQLIWTYTWWVVDSKKEYSGTFIIVITVAAFDFSLSAIPESNSIWQGGAALYSIEVELISGAPQLVDLGVPPWDLPSGATAYFVVRSSVMPTDSTLLVISTSSDTPIGRYTIRIFGAADSLVHSTSVTLTISAAPEAAFDFSLSAIPESVSIRQGGDALYSIEAKLISGTAQPVDLSVSYRELPSGVIARFTLSSVTPTDITLLTISTFSDTPIGTYTVLIFGFAGGLMRYTLVTLTISAALT